MLVYKLNSSVDYKTYEIYNSLSLTVERNKLDIIKFEIPKERRYIFTNEQIIEVNKQYYIVKNIEDMDKTYRIEAHQDIGAWYQFNTKGDYPLKKISYVLNEIKPIDWQINIIGNIEENRTIKAEHRQSFEILEECIKKFDIEYKLDNYNKILTIGKDLGNDLGSFFMTDFNINKQDINVESFEFATRIIPEGMNGLKINQINDGKDYLENKRYSDRTITYYWKDERYTNIGNLKNDAQKKLDILSRPTLTIDLKVQDLNSTNAFKNEYKLLDYVWLIDSHRKVKEKFKIIKAVFYEDSPLENEITLNNKLRDLVSDESDYIELTEKMWEYSRTQFEAYDGEIKASVETSKRYTDDSFRTYKTEREQTDNHIMETISQSTTYIDPTTGQTKPIIDKQLEIEKSVNGINIKIENQTQINTNLDEKIRNTDNNVTSLQESFNSTKANVNSKLVEINALVGNLNQQQTEDVANILKTIESLRAISSDASYEQKASLNTLEDYVRAELSKVESGISESRLGINEINDVLNLYISSLPEEIKQKIDEDDFIINAKKNFSFTNDGLIIGASENRFSVKLDNEQLTFYQDGQEIAYINGNRLYITSAHIIENFRIFNLIFQKYEAENSNGEIEKYVYINMIDD